MDANSLRQLQEDGSGKFQTSLCRVLLSSLWFYLSNHAAPVKYRCREGRPAFENLRCGVTRW